MKPMFDIKTGSNFTLNRNTTSGDTILKADHIDGLTGEGNRAGLQNPLPAEINEEELNEEQTLLIKQKIDEGNADRSELESWVSQTAELATLASNIKISIICGIIVGVKNGINYFKK